jgi:citrate lyase subunit beta / citryl-CoA lyase
MSALMRSKLFVPGSRPELFAKAAASAADALSFDLEDAVAADRKAEARDAVAAFLRAHANGDSLLVAHRKGSLRAAHGKIIVVRANGLKSGLFEADLQAITLPGLDILNLPMVESGEDIREATHILARLEAAAGIPRPIGILANIETPKALRLAAEIATASPRVAGLQIGYADLLEPFGIGRANAGALDHVRMTVRFAAAEAGIAAYDGAFAGIADPQRFREECEQARDLGFAGKSCIHPSQIAMANECFTPPPAEVEKARRILTAAADAAAKGVGAFVVDGGMVDAPFIVRARNIVALAERCDAARKEEGL